MKIPWAQPYTDQAETDAILEVIRSNRLSMGPRVKSFEEQMAAYVGVRHAVAVNSGTAALDTALKCLGIAAGDEVVIPALTYIATANAVVYQHATPVFADVDPVTFNLDPDAVLGKLTPRTKCIIAIDYGGQAADFARLRRIADEHGLRLVEDAAPGLGGEYRGRRNGAHGDMAITSFHTAKIFTTIEGGMVFTDDDRLAATARIIRSQGEDPDAKYIHPVIGHNYRMTEINAAIGMVQMGRAAQVLASRDAAARRYLSRLSGRPGISVPRVSPDATHAWFLFPVLIDGRDAVKRLLDQDGIETNVSWPHPVYAQAPYRGYPHDPCPVSESIAGRVLCLPMFYQISEDAQDFVADRLLAAMDAAA
ncbi:MAG: DegT/DnrJ/EryC1/StrS family aminotransferase [Pseudomonadota bacterium]